MKIEEGEHSNPKRTGRMTLVIALILMLISPFVFADYSIKLDDEGLKLLHVRADIYKDSDSGAEGQKHGEVQVLLTEIGTEMCWYKFQVHLQKATPDTTYKIYVWTYLPDITFSISGNTSNFIWIILEGAASEFDLDPAPGVIKVNLASLGLNTEHEEDSGFSLITDNRGTYKNTVSSGIMTKTELMEYVLDLSWQTFKAKLELGGLKDTVDFEYFSITGFKLHESGEYGYPINVALLFKSVDLAEEDNYCTETLAYTWHTDGFEWVKD
jgi:hypothetical protein